MKNHEILAWGIRAAPPSSRGWESLSEVLGGCPDMPELFICVANHKKQPGNHPGIIWQRLGRYRGSLIEISEIFKKKHYFLK